MPKQGSKKIESDKMRRPRSHENMVVFTFGARKKQELPFVIGVMSDLTGKPKKPLDPVAKRAFLEIDAEQPLEARMAALRPRAAFQVPNVMTPEGGNLSVDIEFQSMDDFKPDRVAAKVGPLRELLEQRERLKNLLSYLDGNPDAEKEVNDLLQKLDALSKEKA
jgi:type VI secretion system protein ImpB